MSQNNQDGNTPLGQPLNLPCGVRLKSRLVKSAMSDSLGDGVGNPTEVQMRLYERWAEGGAALSLIGEVQGSPHYPEKPGNLVLVPDADMGAMRALAKCGSAQGAQIWPQLGHAGALAHFPISHPKGPSPLDVEGLRCDGMSLEDIDELPVPMHEQQPLRRKLDSAVFRSMPATGSCLASSCHRYSIAGLISMAVQSRGGFASSVR